MIVLVTLGTLPLYEPHLDSSYRLGLFATWARRHPSHLTKLKILFGVPKSEGADPNINKLDAQSLEFYIIQRRRSKLNRVS